MHSTDDGAPELSFDPDTDWSKLYALDDSPEVKREKLRRYFAAAFVAPMIDNAITDGMLTEALRDAAIAKGMTEMDRIGAFDMWAAPLLKPH